MAEPSKQVKRNRGVPDYRLWWDEVVLRIMEECQSGRMGRTRNAVEEKSSREFESHLLRSKYFLSRDPSASFLLFYPCL